MGTTKSELYIFGELNQAVPGDPLSDRVLVLDSSQRSALAVTRSLGSRGLRVFTADCARRSIAAGSKFSSAHAHYPDPTESPAAFIDAVRKLISELNVGVVLPMSDVTTMLLTSAGDIGGARLGCASNSAYERLSNKAELVELARELGVPVPRTCVVDSAEAAHSTAQQFNFPIVLKPSRSRYLQRGRIFSTQVRIAENAKELEAIIATSSWLSHIPGLMQEFIDGHGAGMFALADRDRIVAEFAHRRIREKPPGGGVSVLCESVPLDPRIQALAEKLLLSVAWFGPAMIEFRISRSGEPYLMEVNGRFWGSLQLSIDCGVDFPWLLYQLLRGDSPPSQKSYLIGKRLRWLLGDVDNLLIQAKSRRWPRRRALAEFMASFVDADTRQEIFRWSDPKPALIEAGTWLKSLL